MRRKLVLALSLLGIVLGLLWISAQPRGVHAASSDDDDNDFVPGEVVVKLARAADLPAIASQYALNPTPLDQFGSRPIYRLRITDSASVSARVAQLQADPQLRVVYAEPNFLAGAPEANKPSWTVGDSFNAGGDINAYNAQWAAQKIRLPIAHQVTRGAGITVAVLDTGVDSTHPALAGRLVSGYDFVDMDNDPSEVGSQQLGPYGHGTHVAGLIALVAPEAKIMPIRVLDSRGFGNVWVLAEALAYAVDPDGNPSTDDGADVINLSFSTLRQTELLSSMLDTVCSDSPTPGDDDFPAIGNPDVVVIAAAGNRGDFIEEFPAAEDTDGLLAVAATNESDALASFSSRGDWIEVAAPGVNIISSVPGAQYGTWNGTSMAAPLVAGEAALVRAAFPGLRQKKVVKHIVETSKELRGAVEARIDVGKALTTNPDDDDSPSPTPTPTPSPTPTATPTPSPTPSPTPVPTPSPTPTPSPGVQAEIKTWTVQSTTYAHVKLTFSDGGYRVMSWGTVTNTSTDFSADASIERISGQATQAVTTTVEIYTLGTLAPGSYTFTFKSSGVTLGVRPFTISNTPPAPNAIDDQQEFVRQQYRDFLGREADAPGLAFWTDNITKCHDPSRRPAGQTVEQCIDRQRTTTSGAFFLSPEFQYTGYYVYRLYKGALGRAPKLSEFTPDQLIVAAGIIVNNQLSATQIEQNKRTLAEQFTQRAEFQSIYSALNNTQYVDKLFETTGINPSAQDRQELVNRLNASIETRATVLMKVVDGMEIIGEGIQRVITTYGKAFYDKEFNNAFVQMEYFGYMRRDPDEPGYVFWLGKLNLYGNYIDAEMVRSFVVSPEYRSRFGQP